MKTIDTILKDINDRVAQDQPVSPANWIDAAIKLCALVGTEENKLANYEALMTQEECCLIIDRKPAAQAKVLKTLAVDYKHYLELKAKIKRIDEFIRLAKKRSMINEF